MERIAVVLADDHAVVRKGIREFLEQDPSIQVVAEANDGEEAVALVAQEPRRKLLVLDEVRCAHGTMTTRRSFASTCCPGVTSSLLTLPLTGA